MRKNLLLGLLILFTLILFPSHHAHANNPAGMGIADEWIETTLKSVIENDGRLDLRQILVSSMNHEVILEGTVLTDFEKVHAERLAAGIPGVKAVVNNLKVMPTFDQDIALSQQIRTAILQHPLLKVLNLKVTAKDGVVRLNGIVSSPTQKAMIDRMIYRFFTDVKAVTNEISILSA